MQAAADKPRRGTRSPAQVLGGWVCLGEDAGLMWGLGQATRSVSQHTAKSLHGATIVGKARQENTPSKQHNAKV